MDNIYVIIFIIIPLSMFGTGFLVARQLRALENVPLIYILFVQRRLLFSLIVSFFISLVVILGFIDDFTSNLFFSFIRIFLIASFGYYFGIKFGWGNSASPDESIATSTNQVQTDTVFPEHILVENSLASVKITINSKKRWGFFAMEAFQLIFIGLCGFPLLSLLAISLLQNYLPKNLHFLIWLLVGGVALYLLYTKFMEALEFIFKKK